MKRVTIADVAKKAGVSKSTVSHALSGKRPISAATRARIQKTIAELNYQPNPVAQRLAGGKTNTIGFVYPLQSPQLAGLEVKFITSTANVINQSEYTFLMLTAAVDDLVSLQRMIAGGVADGYILMQVWMEDPRIPLLQKAQLPFVLVGRPLQHQELSYVDVDIRQGISEIIDHLGKRRHERLAYFHQDTMSTSFYHQTRQELESLAAERGLSCVFYPCALSYEGGEAAMARLLCEHPETTAVITWNNAATWGAITRAKVAGLAVPEDLSLITLGHSAFSQHLPVPLTVLDTRPEELAAQAAQMLINLLQDEQEVERQRLVKPQLIIRGSTADRRSTGGNTNVNGKDGSKRTS